MTTQYNLSINKDGETLSLSTTDPESLMRIMALAGMDMSSAQVTPCGCDDVSAPAVVVGEESTRFANSVEGQGGETRVVGNTVDFGMKGTGAGKPGSAANKPAGHGDNPLSEKDLEEATAPMLDSDSMLREYAEFKKDKPVKPAEKKKTKIDEIAESISTAHGLTQEAAKPDFLDMDKDGNKTEPMKAAAKDAESVKEADRDEDEYSPVTRAITGRIMNRHLDLLTKYGVEAVIEAIDDVASFVGEVEEIGSSDVSIWTKQVMDQLEQDRGTKESVNNVTESANDYVINGKQVDINSIEVDGVDSGDSPDFADAYIDRAYFVDGTQLDDQELEQLQDMAGDLINDRAHELMRDRGVDAYDYWKDNRYNESADLTALKVLAGVTPTAKKESTGNSHIDALKKLAGI